MRDCKNGIHLFHDSSANTVHHNNIANSVRGIFVNNGATKNTIYSNTIAIGNGTSSSLLSSSSSDNDNQAIVVEEETSKGNIIKGNNVINQ